MATMANLSSICLLLSSENITFLFNGSIISFTEIHHSLFYRCRNMDQRAEVILIVPNYASTSNDDIFEEKWVLVNALMCNTFRLLKKLILMH